MRNIPVAASATNKVMIGPLQKNYGFPKRSGKRIALSKARNEVSISILRAIVVNFHTFTPL